MADPVFKALNVLGDIRYTTPIVHGYQNVREGFVADSSVTQAAIDIDATMPSAMRNGIIRITALNGNVYLAFATTSNTTTAALDPTVRTGNAAIAPWVIPAGTYQDVEVPLGMTHLHHRTASGTAVVTGFISSPRIGWNA